jgi:hypothetical protein
MDSAALVVAVLFVPLFLFLYFFILIVISRKNNNTFPRISAPSYGVQSITGNGEVVKSYSEKRIADYLKKKNIRYLYERSGDFAIRNPDFYLPDYDVYVEFWGLLDADDPWTRMKYEQNMRRKMAIYHRRNKKLVSIYPQNLDNLDWIFRQKFRNVTGLELSS